MYARCLYVKFTQRVVLSRCIKLLKQLFCSPIVKLAVGYLSLASKKIYRGFSTKQKFICVSYKFNFLLKISHRSSPNFDIVL